MNIERIFKIGAIFLLVLLGIVCLFLTNAPSDYYEYSIYYSTPLLVWIALYTSIFIGFIGGILIILYYPKKSFLFVLFMILFLSKIIVLNIPYIRGYIYASLGDTLTHIGLVKNILIDNNFGSNYYPVTHVLLAILTQITGVPVHLISKLFTPLLGIIFIFFTYLLAYRIFNSQTYGFISAMIIAVTFNPYFFAISPNGWSFLYLAVVFSLIYSNKRENKLLLLLTLILIPYFHVLTAFILILALLFLITTQIIINILSKRVAILKSEWKNLFYILLFEIAIFIYWALSFRYFYPNIRTFFDSVLLGSTGYLDEATVKLSKLNLDFIEIIKLTIKTMGDQFIFILFTFFAVLFLIYNRKRIHEKPLLLNFILLNIFMLFLYGSYLFNLIPGGEAFFGERILIISIIFYPICAAYTLYELNSNRFGILFYLCILLILTATLLSMLNLFTSPYILKPNQQVTQKDITGTSWVFDNQGKGIEISSITLNSKRFYDVIYGEKYRQENDLHYQQIPDHFNYHNNNSLGQSLNNDKYIIIVDLDKLLYVTIYKSIGRFVKEDFDNIKFDNSVDKIYNNKGTEVFYARKI